MSKPPRPKIFAPTPADDSAAKRKAAEAERRRANDQRGRADTIFADRDTFGTGAAARAGLKSSLG